MWSLQQSVNPSRPTQILPLPLHDVSRANRALLNLRSKAGGLNLRDFESADGMLFGGHDQGISRTDECPGRQFGDHVT